jgi:hypothetical protein
MYYLSIAFSDQLSAISQPRRCFMFKLIADSFQKKGGQVDPGRPPLWLEDLLRIVW